MIPQLTPRLLFKLIDGHYGYAVNCHYPNSFRLLNRRQFNILSAINSRDDVETIAGRLGLQTDMLSQFLQRLSETEIVTFNGESTTPRRPDKPRSLNFWIHTTNACNLGCSYCYISTLNTGKGMSALVRQQLVYKLTEAAVKHGIRHIKLRLAGGEPLGQFKSWRVFISEASMELNKVGCKLDIAFITNLTMLDDEIIEFSKKHHISYGVSLDGIGDMQNATRRFRSGAGTFDIVDKNLHKLLEAAIPVSVNTVVNNLNLAGLPDLTNYLIALDVPFRYSIVKGEAIDSTLLDHSLSETHAIMQEAIEQGWQFSKRYQFCDLKPNDLGFQTCASGFSGGAIYIDGSFKYCHVHFGKETDPSPSIFDNDRDLLEMIESGEHLEDKKSADCKKCRYQSICTSGCPVYRVDDKDPQCSLYHRFIPKYFDLQGRERLHLLRKCETV